MDCPARRANRLTPREGTILTKLSNHPSASITKMLIIGDSGTGKTGSVAALASAGYNVRILDLDNGVDIIRSVLTHPFYVPSVYPKDAIERVEVETVTDSMKNVKGRLVPGKATVWQRMTDLLADWKSDTTTFGSITTWGEKDVLVIDNLTRATKAALYFNQGMNARIGQKVNWDDIYSTQQSVETLMQILYDDAVKCQVIVLAHPDYIKGQDGLERGYPGTIGNKLSPMIGSYFNNVIEAKSFGSGKNRVQKLLTKGSGMIEVKTSNPGGVKDEYLISHGLAELFADLQAKPKGIVV